MAEQFTQLDVLTDAERAAIEQPGLKQRARTLLVVAELATALGVSADIREALLERVRGMDGQEAKRLRKGASQLNDVVSGLELSAQPAPEAATEAQPEQKVALVPEVEETSSSNLEETLPEGENYMFDLEAVQSFYRVINKKTSSEWLTVPDDPSDVDVDEILAIIALDARSIKKPVHAGRITDKFITLLQADAPNNQSTHSFKFSRTKQIANLLDSLGSGNPEAALATVELSAPVKTPDMKELDDEPAYVRIAQRYETLIGFDSAEATAFRCLINPDNRGEMTDNKVRAVGKVRERIVAELGSLHGVRGELTPAEAIRVANLLGFFIREKNTGEQPPIELSQQLRRVGTVEERRALTINLHRGLDKLADLFEDEEIATVPGEVLSLPLQRPLQVQISNGKPVLA